MTHPGNKTTHSSDISVTARPTPLGRVLRVGVTGARDLDTASLPQLQAAVAAVLQDIDMHSKAAAPIRLELLSPLAEGADRLVADLAVKHGYALVCPLPFPQAEYERDFTTLDSLAEFRELLARAEGRVLALDGARGDHEARSYEAVGRLIVRNCDLIVGIWNGRPGKGLGGTADTIRYAASFGPPVIWLHAADPAPARWIEDAHDLRPGAPERPVDPQLVIYLARLLNPPAHGHGGGHGVLQAGGHLLRRGWRLCNGRRHHSLLDDFLAEPARPARSVWRLHGWLMRTLSGRNPPWTPPHPPANPVAARWFAHYQPANDRAGESSARYRSSYVMAFGFGAIALSDAAGSLAASDWPAAKITATIVELAALAGILLLVMLDGMREWQRRAIQYRLLAELCRKQQALAPLAWAVPRAGSWATTAPHRPHEADTPHDSHAAWVTWLFSAWLREAPLPTGTIDAAWVASAREAALTDLLKDQIEYHRTRRAQSHRAGRALRHLGEAAFGAVFLVVGVKLWLLLSASPAEAEARHRWVIALGLAGAILPAISAAFFGIRAYAELELLAEQSHAMLAVMERARDQIAQLDPAAPLASQTLGSALASVATTMLEDLEGWARLFSAKVVEA